MHNKAYYVGEILKSMAIGFVLGYAFKGCHVKLSPFWIYAPLVTLGFILSWKNERKIK